MGLDVRALPLSKYWSASVSTVMEKFAAKAGLPPPAVTAGGKPPARKPRRRSPPPKSYAKWVSREESLMSAWKGQRTADQPELPPVTRVFAPLGAIQAALGRAEAEGLPWDENDWTREAGDPLGWESFNGLTEYAGSLKHGDTRFPHLMRVSEELGFWVPGIGTRLLELNREAIGLGGGIFGNRPFLVGSLDSLLKELEGVNRRWKLKRDWGELEDGEGIADDDDPDVFAKTGWAILRSVARKAKQLDCPVLLDG